METLPEEMVLEITRYLSEGELAACCAVSRAWRDVFNRDVIWRQRCDAELADHLRDTKCVVEPCFENPEIEGSGLSPVSEGRLSYMRYAHLHRNWRYGRYKTFGTVPNAEYDLTGSKMAYMKNDFLLLFGAPSSSDGRKQTIQLWGIKRNLYLLSECDLKFTSKFDYHHESLDVYENHLIFKQRDGIVQVFQISNFLLEPRYTFLVTDAQKHPDSLVPQESFTSTETVHDFEAVLFGLVYLAIELKPNKGRKLYVWNIESGKKLKEETYENLIFEELFECACNSSIKKAVLGVGRSNSSALKILVYDLSQLAFTKFSVSLSRFKGIKCALHNEYIVVSFKYSFLIYDLATSRVVHKIPQNTVKFVRGVYVTSVCCHNRGTFKLIKLKGFEKQIDQQTYPPLCSCSQNCLLLKSKRLQYFLNVERLNGPSCFLWWYKLPLRGNVKHINKFFTKHIIEINHTRSFSIIHYW